MYVNEWLKKGNCSVAEILSDYCIVNEEILKLDDIEKWGYQDFINFVQQRIPKKLYKYFPNKCDENGNYSLDALRDNTVYLSFPEVFDDIYDSDISISFDEFERLRTIEYCKRAGCRISDSACFDEAAGLLLNKFDKCDSDNYISIFDSSKCSELENLANELFCERIKCKGTNSFAIHFIMKAEYKYCLEQLKNTFKTTCFATNPLSQLMWSGSYANLHQGFCLEYSISDGEKYRGIYENLFPLVYSKVRSNMEKEFIGQIDSFPSVEDLKNIYIHGALRKSIDWAFQNEWRLLLLEGSPDMKNSKVKFFPITKVYIGSRMDEDDKNEIIDICESRGIEYVGVKKRQDIFEMEECPIRKKI